MSTTFFRSRSVLRALWALVLALLFPGLLCAGGPPYGIPSGVMPWEYHKYYKGYREPFGPGSHAAPPASITMPPSRYTVLTARIPYAHKAEDPNAVLLMAHVPDGAAIWLQDQPTKQQGAVRYFLSPPLVSGYAYAYSVRVAWKEDEQWVAQTVKVPVEPGEVRCFYIVHADQAKELAEITANLEKLTPEQQKVALLQKSCPVQPDKPLGSMGVPALVSIKGESVFLCCEACTKKATSNPEQTLERVRKLRSSAAQHKVTGS